MSEQIILNADPRERTGSNKARVIRNIDGMVPAIIYGAEKDSLNIKLRLNELTKASQNELFLYSGSSYQNRRRRRKSCFKRITERPCQRQISSC